MNIIYLLKQKHQPKQILYANVYSNQSIQLKNWHSQFI